MSDTSEFSEDQLVNVLLTSRKEPTKITEAAKWILRFPEHADTIIKVWKSFLWDAALDRQLSALYIVNDIGYRWKRNKALPTAAPLISAFSSIVAECMGHVYHNSEITAEKRAKLEHLSDVWCKQGLYPEASAACREAMGLMPYIAGALPSPPSTVINSDPGGKKPRGSGPGTPSKQGINDSVQIASALAALAPSPATSTWIDITDFPDSMEKVVKSREMLTRAEREMRLARDRAGQTEKSLKVTTASSNALPNLDAVTTRANELERDTKYAYAYQSKLLETLDICRRYEDELYAAFKEAEERTGRLRELSREIQTDLSLVGSSKAALRARRVALGGSTSNDLDSPAGASTVGPSSSSSSSSPSPSQSSRSASSSKDTAAAAFRQQSSSSSTRDSRGSGEVRRDGNKEDRRDDRRDSRDNRRDDRRSGDREDSRRGGERRGSGDDHDRRFKEPSTPVRQDDRRRGSSGGSERERGRGGGRSGGQSGTSNGGSNKSSSPSPSSSSNRASSSSLPRSSDTTGSSASQPERMQESEPSPSSNPPTQTTAAKRRNREEAGLQLSSTEASGTKRQKLEETVVTEFFDECEVPEL